MVAKVKKKILVVDDDPHIVRLLRDKLTAPGRTILEASNGLEAVKTALREIPDLIVLDVMMPRMNGYQACRFIRSVPALKGTRILFITVKQGAGDRQRGLLRGADDYLTKPFEMAELEEKVSALLRKRKARGPEGHTVGAAVEIPAPEQITDQLVVSITNSILDESVHSLSLLEKVSQHLISAVDRSEILRTTLAAVVSPVGLGWDRVLLMTVGWERGQLGAELAFALSEKPDEGAPQWRHLQGKVRHRTMEELLDEGLKGFQFQAGNTDEWMGTLHLKMDTAMLSARCRSYEEALELLGRSCRGARLESYLSGIFWNREVALAPLWGKEKVFGVLAADRYFSHGAIRAEEVNHLRFLCRQAGLAMERQVQHQEVQVRAWEYERLSLLNESILKGVDLGVAFLDNDGHVRTWNEAMARFTGVKEKKAGGRLFFDLFPVLRGTLVEQRYRESREMKAPRRVGHYALSFGRAKKGVFDVRFGTVTQAGREIGTVMIWEDVQLRVTLEQRNMEAHRYLASLVEHSGDAILTVGAQGRIKSWNAAAGEIFGYGEKEIVGRGVSALFEPARRGEAKTLIARTLAEGRVVNHVDTFLRKSGEPLEASVTTSRVDLGGEGGGDVAAIIRDITERRRMESQLFQTEKLASMGIMAAGMAHEINNPLTSIMMYAQILGMRQDLQDEDRNCVEKIEEDAGRIADIVNSLLVFSRPSSRRVEEVDLHDTMEKAISFLTYQSARKKIRISRSLCEGLPPLHGMRTEIQEIFLNLLINARDALPDEGEIRLVSRYHPPPQALPEEAAVAGQEGFVEVSVSDDGSGIAREHLPKIFDPFFTTKPPGRGTGLGLAVVRRLVENHQGTITVRSVPGKGSTFTVRLPVG